MESPETHPYQSEIEQLSLEMFKKQLASLKQPFKAVHVQIVDTPALLPAMLQALQRS